jgi:hypothetical protein
MNSPPPLEYLVTSSQAGLENFELGKMNQIANLRKELGDLIEEWIEAETQSRLARWILECRRTQDAAARTQMSERDAPLLVEDIAASLLPPSDRQPEPPEARSPHVRGLFDSSPLSCRDPRTSKHPLSLLRPKLSERAEDALNFLEQQGRSETAAIGVGAHKSEPQTDRAGAASGSARNAVQDRYLHKSPGTAPLFSEVLEGSEASENECRQARRFAADNSAERSAVKRRAVADSAASADCARIVPLVRREKLRPSAPVRASMRYSATQRKAV